MPKGSSARRNSTFDLTKVEFVKPQNRLEANRWLDKVTFGAATAPTDIQNSTKTSIVPISGAVDESVALMNSTYKDYLDAEFSKAPMFDPTQDVCVYGETHFLHGNEVFGTPSQYLYGVTSGYHRWFYNEALYGARARAKATYALSQIVVCRQGSATFQQMTQFVGHLFDATLSKGTNTYREMLKRVTYNDAMGVWLTYRNNEKADPVKNTRPDENYAREIMQLFSIGLDCLNMDGTPLRDANGEIIPTYKEDYVSEAAKFFTGLRNVLIYGYPFHMNNDGTKHETSEKKGLVYPDGSQAILPAQTSFATAPDTFSNPNGYTVTVVDANNFTVEADTMMPNAWTGTVSVGFATTPGGTYRIGASTKAANSRTYSIRFNNHGLTTGQKIYSKCPVEESIDFFIDQLVNHPTCPPFIAGRLIKLLVTNNPSPGYIRRVAEKFVDNGNGVRGDLSAVFKAIFLDRECIIPYGKNPNNHGRTTTLLDRTLKLASGLRNDIVHVNELLSDTLHERNVRWGSRSRALSSNSQVETAVYSVPRDRKECGGIVPDRTYFAPQPFNSPSVFNFFRPGYVPPKTVFAENGLTAPELQIISAETQTIWTSAALAATHYGDLQNNYSAGWEPTGTSTGAATDPRGGRMKTEGLNFQVGTGSIEVISTRMPGTTLFITGRIRDLEPFGTGTGTSGGWRVNCYHRRLGGYFSVLMSSRPNAGGDQTFEFEVSGSNDFFDRLSSATNPPQLNPNTPSLFQAGDILDTQPLFVNGHSGFPGKGVQTGWQPFITLLHNLATKVPDTETVTDAQLNSCIDYIQDILATREISPEIRALMLEAAKKPITLPVRFAAANPSHDNLYQLMIYGYSQIRVRRMLAVYIVSPEFITQY